MKTLLKKSSIKLTIPVLLILVIIASFIGMAVPAFAANKIWDRGANNDNWGSANNWNPNGVPIASDTVTLNSGNNIIVDVNASCASITFPSSTTNNVTLSINSGVTLNVSGTITIPRASSGEINTLAVGTGTLNAGSIAFTSTGGSVRHQITISTGTVNVDGNITTNDTSQDSPTITFTGAGLLQLGGSIYTSSQGTLTAFTGSTVEYNAAGNQTVQAFTYHNLSTSGSGTKTLGGTTTINGNLSIGSGTTLDVSPSSYALTINGNFANSGTFTPRSGTVTLSGASAQTMTGATTFYRLVLNNSNGLTIANDETISNALTLTNGKITTGANKIILSYSSGTITNANNTRYIVGGLQKVIPTGAQSRTFEVGGTNYDPVTVAFGNVTTAGNLIARVASGQHPNIGTSTINSAKDVALYWTLTNSSIFFNNYNATFTFVVGDVIGGADTSQFIVGKYDGSWTYPTVGTKGATSTQATGLTAFSDFVVGEVAAGEAETFTVSYPSTTISGANQNLIITAKDSGNNTATGYTGTVQFASSDSGAELPSNYTFTSGDNGTHAFNNVVLKTAGTQSIMATDTVTSSITGTQSGITVTASTLVVSDFPSTTTAGEAHNITVTAKDILGNTATNYTGTVSFTSSDGQATLPVNSTLTSGTGSFNVTLKTAGSQSITATDTMNGSVTGAQSSITVNPAVKNKLVWGTQPPASAVAGAIWTSFTVKITDQYNNQTADTDNVTITPNSGSLGGTTTRSAVNGVATFNDITRTLVGTLTVTATASDLTSSPASGTITIGFGSATNLVVSGYPSPVSQGAAGSFTVTAKDAYGNTATGYRGTVHFTSSDPAATLPGNYTFTSGDNGVHSTFSATFNTAGTQSITATDTTTSSITGVQSDIQVNPTTTLKLEPNAQGDSTTLYLSGDDDNWDACNDSNGGTSYVSSGWTGYNNYRYDLYNLPNTTLTGTITSIVVYMEACSENPPTRPSAQTVIQTYDTIYYGPEITLTQTYSPYSTPYVTNPFTHQAWTWDEINSLQIGPQLRNSKINDSNDYSRCTNVWVVVNFKNSSTTILTPSPSPSMYGDSVTFTATVTGTGGTPTGTVTFKEGATTLDTQTLASGLATYSTSALIAGDHTITADYSGDSTFAGSSNDATLTVNKATLTVTTDSKTKIVGETFADFTGSVSGLKNGDSITASYSSAGAPASAIIGTYEISAALTDPGSKLDNYNRINHYGNLTVNPDGSSGYWYLYSNGSMVKGTPSGGGSLPIANGATITLLTNQGAQGNVTFEAGDWHIFLNSSSWTSGCTVTIGTESDEDMFGSTSSVTSSNGVLMAVVHGTGGTVADGDKLVLSIRNTSGTDRTITTDASSYMCTPENAPNYPVPEAATLVLFGLGLAGIGGFVMIRRKKNNKATL